MKLETTINGEIILKEIYVPILLESGNKETIYISTSDSGFEFTYQGGNYVAENGHIKKSKS